jgi:hypothetical protein
MRKGHWYTTLIGLLKQTKTIATSKINAKQENIKGPLGNICPKITP